MKKLIVLLLFFVSIMITADNFDKYESKKVLDKYFDIFISKDLKKYNNDKDLKPFYDETNQEFLNAFLKTILLKNYEVISVQENPTESKIILSITYNTIDKITNKAGIEKEIKKYYKQNPVTNKYQSSMYTLGTIIYLQSVVDDYVEYKTETKTIDVIMYKESNDRWYLGNNPILEIMLTNLEKKLNEAEINYF